MASVTFLGPQDRCSQCIKSKGKCLSSTYLQCGPWQQPSQEQGFELTMIIIWVLLALLIHPATTKKRMCWLYAVSRPLVSQGAVS